MEIVLLLSLEEGSKCIKFWCDINVSLNNPFWVSMASYGQYKDFPSPSPSLASNNSKNDANSLSRGISGPSGINHSNNVTATLRKSSISSKSPRAGIGVHSPLPPMIGGTPNHNGLGQSPNSNASATANSSSPSSSLSNLTGAFSKRFTGFTVRTFFGV